MTATRLIPEDPTAATNRMLNQIVLHLERIEASQFYLVLGVLFLFFILVFMLVKKEKK